jgi:hypothetical protein
MARRGGPIRKDSAGYKSGQKSAKAGMDAWVKEIEKGLGKVVNDAEARMEKAVEVLAKEAMELTPRDDGDLQGAQYSYVKREGGQIVGVVGYDTEKAPHALVVHEREANHSQKDYPNNGPRATWKYLEFALRNKAQEIAAILKGGSK